MMIIVAAEVEMFSPQQLERFHLHDAKIQRQAHSHLGKANNSHKKTYLKGFIRCVKCRKWIHPDDPEDAKEIFVARSGKRIHRPCPSISFGVSAFATVPRFHGTRRRRLDAIKRY